MLKQTRLTKAEVTLQQDSNPRKHTVQTTAQVSKCGQAGAPVWRQTNVHENHHRQISLMVPVCREEWQNKSKFISLSFLPCLQQRFVSETPLCWGTFPASLVTPLPLWLTFVNHLSHQTCKQFLCKSLTFLCLFLNLAY